MLNPSVLYFPTSLKRLTSDSVFIWIYYKTNITTLLFKLNKGFFDGMQEAVCTFFNQHFLQTSLAQVYSLNMSVQ